MYYVYILCCADDSLYTGYTNDVEKRLRQHRGELPGGARYTHAHPPKKLVCLYETAEKGDALRLEALIKHLTRQEKQSLIADPAALDAIFAGKLDASRYSALDAERESFAKQPFQNNA